MSVSFLSLCLFDPSVYIYIYIYIYKQWSQFILNKGFCNILALILSINEMNWNSWVFFKCIAGFLFDSIMVWNDTRFNNFTEFFLLCIETNILESLKLKL